MKFAIDGGHGGHDPGAVSAGVEEATIKLNLSRLISDGLRSLGHEVLETRPGDFFVPLSTRAKKANDFNADYTISLHCNAAERAGAEGIETYHFPGSRGGEKLAKKVHNRLIADHPTRVNRGVKTARFSVLRNTKMPAILIEFGFLTNPEERDWLQSSENQSSLANSVILALTGQNPETQTNC